MVDNFFKYVVILLNTCNLKSNYVQNNDEIVISILILKSDPMFLRNECKMGQVLVV
jgi:hypothetical protein